MSFLGRYQSSSLCTEEQSTTELALAAQMVEGGRLFLHKLAEGVGWHRSSLALRINEIQIAYC
jgi:hypothetical protein